MKSRFEAKKIMQARYYLDACLLRARRPAVAETAQKFSDASAKKAEYNGVILKSFFKN